MQWNINTMFLLWIFQNVSTSDISKYQALVYIRIDIMVFFYQEVALLDVRKEITFCRKVNIPIIGIVENMTTFVCPKCRVMYFYVIWSWT